MNFKQIVQDYFTFSRNERKGITILLVIVFFLAVANKVIFYFETPAKIETSILDTALYKQNVFKDSINLHTEKTVLFKFNPNTINGEALDNLSLPQGVKRNLLKFREKGGKFYSNTDIRKIYGITDSIYYQLTPFLIFDSEIEKPIQSGLSFEFFPFDPNTATDNDFMRLGFSEKQIKTIRKYLSKAGNFKSKGEFLKIYGISESQRNALNDFIVIHEKENIKVKNMTEVANTLIEINEADSVILMELPGIGDKLSKRIVKYRDLLGGFYSITQLKEVYGLKAEVIQQIEGKIKVDMGKIRKVDLNFAEWNELAKHPYIQKNLAKQIIKFRTKYGSIHDPSVLRDSMILNIDEYTRLKPYL